MMPWAWSYLGPALLAVARIAVPCAAQDSVMVQRITSEFTNQRDWYGYSVDALSAPLAGEGSETLVLVGSARDGAVDQPFPTGAGYVFARDHASASFVEEARLVWPTHSDQGEDVALLRPDPDDDWLALVGGGGAGHVWRRTSPGTWAHRVMLLPPGATYEYGGRAVGAARDSVGAEYAALSDGDSVLVWRRAPAAPDDASGWLLDGGLSVIPQAGLSLERGALAMWAGLDGAVRLAFPVFTNPLAVVVFERNPATGAWTEETRLHGSVLLPGNWFGYSSVAAGIMPIAPGGDEAEFVLVGAPWRTQPLMPGQSYLFRRGSSGGWTEDAVFHPPPGSGTNTFGLGGAFEENVLIVSGISRFWTFTRTGAGAWEPSGLVETFQTYGAADRTGTALSLPYLVFGDYLNEDLGFQAGAAWVFTLPGSLTPAEPDPEAATVTLSVTPQPARGEVRVRYTLPSPAPARLALHDVLGREVWRHDAPAGASGVTFEAGALRAGVYVLRLETGEAVAVRRLVIAR